MGAGGIIQQRAEVRQCIEPGTANHARLPPTEQTRVAVICAKGLDDWTDIETSYMGTMVVLALLAGTLPT